MPQPILQVENLSVAFGENQVVSEVSFELHSNEVLGIVGESGSGKSVTCLSILKLLPESGRNPSGKITFQDSESKKTWHIDRLSEDEMRHVRGKRISLIFQEPFSALNPIMKCGAQIKEAVDLHLDLQKDAATEYIKGLLQKVGIQEVDRVYNSYPHELSGGQLQRIMIAMAVSCHPDIIIADEPTTALDVTIQKGVLNLFKDLQKEYNCSIIFISHDLGVISEIADRVMVMQKGKVVESGPIDEVFHQPKQAYTQGLIACRPPQDFRIHRLPTVQDYLTGRIYMDRTRYQKISPIDFQNRIKNVEQSEVIIQTTELQVNYPVKTNFWGKVTESHQAVKPLNLTIHKGETLGVVGESGSGKSSLGKALLNLNPHASGSVLYRGSDIYQLPDSQMRELRKKIQIIFQDPYSTLNPKMKIGHAIKEVLDVHGIGLAKERKEKVLELLCICGLESDHYDRYPHEFSGGQRQRISIARTLAVDPEFIVCDESVSALDVSVQAQILNLLKDLQEERDLTYLFISHDLSVIRHMSDHVLVMNDGVVVEQKDAETIFNKPEHSYTQHLFKSIPGITS